MVDASEPARSQLGHRVHAGLLLVRAPLVTRDLTSFEKAFHLYQRRLNERLALPFTRYFYFKKGTPADLEWKRKIKDRRTPARDIGLYHAYTDESWNDEVAVGARESEVDHQVEALVHDAETSGLPADEEMGEKRKEAVDRPCPRLTEADRQGDLASLNRRLDRTLYLLARKPDGRWRFPAAELLRRESLHQVRAPAPPSILASPSRADLIECGLSGLMRIDQATERIIVQTGGVNVNTWVVGHAPVGHYTFQYRPAGANATTDAEHVPETTYFMKARIMAGQANLSDNRLGFSEFRWLCKDEIQPVVTPGYWSAIRRMLADR